jgi:hypothetical protein
MVKVLKSFTSAHDAVNWMTRNRIEDASIEMTGTLKSLGVVKVPSGNYHVVLKGNPLEFIGNLFNRGNKANKVSKESRSLFDARRDDMRRADRIENSGKPINRRRSDLDEMEVLSKGDATGPTLYHFPNTTYKDRIRNYVETGSFGMDKKTSISREDLVTIITKSVLEVLKGNQSFQDQAPSFQDQAVETAAGVREIEKRLRQNPGDKSLLAEMHRLTGGLAGVAADPSMDKKTSISREDLVTIITKSVMEVLKDIN